MGGKAYVLQDAQNGNDRFAVWRIFFWGWPGNGYYSAAQNMFCFRLG